MPKLGMEPIRRAALVEATIAELGRAGTLDITVSQIARRAGVSSGLAHHYFGGKDDIFAAAMRQILKELKQSVEEETARATTPEDRLRAILRGCLSRTSFDPVNVNAWMLFYAFARTSPKAARLLRVYQRRLRTHLQVALRPLSSRPEQAADTLGALIDGIYLRAALGREGTPEDALSHALSVADSMMETSQ